MIAYLFDENGEFKYSYKCQLDPLESEKQGKQIYLQPANSTLIAPPDAAENHKAIWNGIAWEDIDFTPQEIIEEPKELTEEEKLDLLREQREIECFSIVNRGQLWYNTLTTEQVNELNQWYMAWLDVTETKIIPTRPIWLK
mgnify:CR=1 FL=1